MPAGRIWRRLGFAALNPMLCKSHTSKGTRGLRINRRTFLGSSLALASLGAAAPSAAHAAADPKRNLIGLAKTLLERNASKVARTDIVALADFSVPSWRPRFHLVDMVGGTISSHLTAHGRGSDPAHTGWLKKFSNEIGSNASSDGAYVTGSQYDGKYGRAMRLSGLDPQNSNAEARAIVIHHAWYVSDDMIAKYGKLGRSEGCFALDEAGIAETIAALGPGRLLYAGKLDAIRV